jgi:predicted Zn-dependent peptidase
VLVERPGNAAYVRAVYHSPGFAADGFYALLLLDAVLSGAKGINLWSGAGGGARRSSFLHRRLVETGIAAGVSTSLPPTQEPYLYSILVTSRDGVPPEEAERALMAALEEFPSTGLVETELEKAMNQVRARLVFESASVTDMAHQLGYFATIADYESPGKFAEALARVTPDAVRQAARSVLAAGNRTVGLFRPLPEADEDARNGGGDEARP